MAKIAVKNVSILIMEKSVTEIVYAKQSIATILKDVKLVSILSLKLKKIMIHGIHIVFLK